jgi:hypothetical protein
VIDLVGAGGQCGRHLDAEHRPAKAAEAVSVPPPEEGSTAIEVGALQDFGAAGPVLTRARIPFQET